jgi:hypothetical protein
MQLHFPGPDDQRKVFQNKQKPGLVIPEEGTESGASIATNFLAEFSSSRQRTLSCIRASNTNRSDVYVLSCRKIRRRRFWKARRSVYFERP